MPDSRVGRVAGSGPGQPTAALLLRLRAGDWVTLAHALCGYVALAILVDRWHSRGSGVGRGVGVTIADLRLAGALVSLGAVFDLIDGPVARRFGSSGLGDLLDGMCDTVTFGAVPAVVIAASGAGRGEPGRLLLMCAGGVFLVAMILRLVRTEATGFDVVRLGFCGLPSAPASAVAIGIVALYATPWLTCVLVVILAALVTGAYHYPRQRLAFMPMMAGGPAIGLLGVWGVLPLRPAVVAMALVTIVLPVAAASVTRRAYVSPGS